MSPLVYGSVCSGIEAATVAWHPLGWTPAFFSEIEAFPRAVLAHHYPAVQLHGDFTTIRAGEYGPIQLLIGGTPCQSFSVAGLRGGLADDRGNLALEFLRLAQRLRPRWVVWENVPGVLSSNDGRDFGSILGGLAELGYGWAYRVLDAQYFGLAQRRRRVFVVGCLGDWRRAVAVLFERHSLSGHPAPRRETGQGTPRGAARSVAVRGRDGIPQVELGDEVANAILTPNGGRAGIGVGAVLSHDPACTLTARERKGPLQEADLSTVVAHALRGRAPDLEAIKRKMEAQPATQSSGCNFDLWEIRALLAALAAVSRERGEALQKLAEYDAAIDAALARRGAPTKEASRE